MICKGCKYYKYKLWAKLIYGLKRPDRCKHPEVKKVLKVREPFCSVALMWPCTDGKLKEEK